MYQEKIGNNVKIQIFEKVNSRCPFLGRLKASKKIMEFSLLFTHQL